MNNLNALELNKLYNEDCKETLARLSDDSINHVITSPPYNINRRVHSGKWTVRSANEAHKYGGRVPDALTIEEYYIWQHAIITELLRVASGYVFYNIQMVTGNKPALFRLIGAFSNQIKEVFIWDKINAEPAISAGVLNSGFEFVFVLSKTDALTRQFKSCNFTRGHLSNVIHLGKNTRNKSANNSAVMPTALPLFFIENFAKEGEIIYDPFSGKGTVLAAAFQKGCRFLGSEICPIMFAEAQTFINQYTKTF